MQLSVRISQDIEGDSDLGETRFSLLLLKDNMNKELNNPKFSGILSKSFPAKKRMRSLVNNLISGGNVLKWFPPMFSTSKQSANEHSSLGNSASPQFERSTLASLSPAAIAASTASIFDSMNQLLTMGAKNSKDAGNIKNYRLCVQI